MKDIINSVINTCNKQYFDQRFYGNAALNRRMMLDPEITNKLSKEDIIEIFTNEDEYKIQRSSTGQITLASAIKYAFIGDPYDIKYMPPIQL